VTVRVDCGAPRGPLRRIWTSFGFDEINWTSMPAGKRRLKTIAEFAERPYYVRSHYIFNSGIGWSLPHWGAGNVYHEDGAGMLNAYRMLSRLGATRLAVDASHAWPLDRLDDGDAGMPEESTRSPRRAATPCRPSAGLRIPRSPSCARSRSARDSSSSSPSGARRRVAGR
jgi:hypothetical protein